MALCPLVMVVGCGCESGKGVPGVAGFAGAEAPPLEESATCEPVCPVTEGCGVEVFTMGRAGEEGIAPGERLEGLGVMYVAISSVSTG